MNRPRLRVAAQRAGRLADNSLDLLARCGVHFSRSKDRLFCFGEDFPLDLLLVRDDDIPRLLAEGACDLGIVGANVAEERRLAQPDSVAPRRLRVLGFATCRLSIAVPEDETWSEVSDLAGRRIATTYPGLLQRFLAERRVAARVVPLAGSVELAPRLGTADAVCDLVSSGATLAANHLREMATVFESEAGLYLTPRALAPAAEDLIARLVRRIEGVLQVKDSKYVMLHAPRAALPAIKRLLPGAESPTVLPLEGESDRVAVHAVCRETVFWEHLEGLREAGASAVLVLPVEKMLA